MKLRELHLKGYKSIDGDIGQTLNFGDVTVLLGANGSGKSNLISFFQMLNCMATGGLTKYVAKQGANRLLFYGPKQSESISFKLGFNSESMQGNDTYEIMLSYGLQDRLFINSEKVTLYKKSALKPQEYFLKSVKDEPGLKKDTRKTSKELYRFLSNIRVYQFHDTSDTAKIRSRVYVDDAKYLHHDAGNLAAFLKMLKEREAYTKYYERIVRHIQRVMPQFSDFDLEPISENKDYIRLNWNNSTGSDYLLDPHQISDGSLRFMALATLLLQPPDLLPKFIVLDEPELGLHPAAVSELHGMVKMAAQKTQLLLATQSTRLVDEFSLENLLIVERDPEKHCSVFKKLNPEQLKDWLYDYSLSELWEKNVLGGQP